MNDQSWKGEHLIRCQKVAVEPDAEERVRATSKIDIDRLRELASRGLFQAEIAREMGVSEFGIHRAVKRLGITLSKGKRGYKPGGWKI